MLTIVSSERVYVIDVTITASANSTIRSGGHSRPRRLELYVAPLSAADLSRLGLVLVGVVDVELEVKRVLDALVEDGRVLIVDAHGK